jgi:hypothetical protein
VKLGATLLVPVGAAFLVACGSGNSQPATKSAATVAPLSVSGHVVIKPSPDIIGDGGYYTVGSPCDGQSTITSATDGKSRRYFSTAVSDIASGARITITNAQGSVIGVANLAMGKWQASPTTTNLQDHTCVMPWTASVPHSDFYGVAIAGRTPVQFSAAEATAGNADIPINGGLGQLG